MRKLIVAAAVMLGLMAAPASADVQSASDGAFVINAEAQSAAAPAQAQRALGQIGRWWNAAHTYSGDSNNLRLDLSAGGCLCERWGDRQSVEHMRVVLIMNHESQRTIRLAGALGPLQEMGVTAILTYTIRPDAAGSHISMTYRVSGDPGLGLASIAPAVDSVMAEQFRRFISYSNGDAPN